MHPGIRPIESLLPRASREFGGKAQNLAALSRAGFPVPAAYALSAELCEEHYRTSLPSELLPLELLRVASDAQLSEKLAEARKRIEISTVQSALRKEIRRVLSDLRQSGAVAFAVRSSSLREDEKERSFAGMHETILGCKEEDEVFDAVRKCWASLFEPRVFAYLMASGESERLAVGVVIQAMVPADVAGVLFTVNPISGDHREMVLNASFGLGTTVVDGTVSPDTYRIDKASGWVRDRVLGEKNVEIRLEKSGLKSRNLSDEEAHREALTAAQVRELAQLGVKVENHFGGPRDIEWAIAAGTLYLLQARPVTALAKTSRKRNKVSKSDRSKIVWSNVNVGEALPGVATPLTWSVLSSFSDRGFRQAFGSLGCSVPEDAELVTNFRGRIYLNLSECLSIASQVPFLSPNSVLSLGGGGELERLELEYEKRSSKAFIARLPRTILRFVRENQGLSARIEEFEMHFEEDRSRMVSLDFRLLSATALHRVLRDVERMLDRAGLVMLNVYGNLLASVVVLKTIVRFFAKGDSAELASLLRELLTGLVEVESAAPGLELFRIAALSRHEPKTREALKDASNTMDAVFDLPEGMTKQALLEFFDKYGERGAREAEIAEPRWREDPTVPLSTLKLHLKQIEPHEGPLGLEQRQREVRLRAEENLLRQTPLPLRPLVRRFVTLVQAQMRQREKLRSHVVSVLGLYRKVALDASRRIFATEPMAGIDAAFFLSIEELHAILRGDVPQVATLVARRRLQFHRDEKLKAPPDTFVGFPDEHEEEVVPPGAELRGLAASSGKAKGYARVLWEAKDAASFAPGEILVASIADVGWSPLFLAAAAVVTDLGGPLSHASVVAREFGVPAVVNVKVGMQRIRTGDYLEVDGDNGVVRILKAAADEAVASDAKVSTSKVAETAE